MKNIRGIEPSSSTTNLQDADPLVVLQNSSDLNRLRDGNAGVVGFVAAARRRIVEAKLDVFEPCDRARARPAFGLGTVNVDVHVPRSLVALVHR